MPVRLGDRPQPLAREPLDDHRQEVRPDRRAVADLLVGILHVPRDRLAREHAAELVCELRGRRLQAIAHQRLISIGMADLQDEHRQSID